jgi:protoheme IX farnesyltransferase
MSSNTRAIQESAPASATARAWALVVLTKPDVTFLVAITTLAGFYLGSPGALDFSRLAHTVFGTLLIAGGTSALNQYFERDQDALMRRTARRPLPAGVLQPAEALRFGVGLCVAGAVYLIVAANWLAALLGVATTAGYLGGYTPLKRRTPWSTFVGAFPGAVPPLIGWAAAGGSLSVGAWTLFAILFLWQFPHFLAIAWMYREDYARAGIRMLPTVDPTGDATFRQILGTAALLIPVSMLPAVISQAGVHYFFGALVLSMLLMQACLWAARDRSNLRAKWLMHATVIYIPVLLALLMWDKIRG